MHFCGSGRKMSKCLNIQSHFMVACGSSVVCFFVGPPKNRNGKKKLSKIGLWEKSGPKCRILSISKFFSARPRKIDGRKLKKNTKNPLKIEQKHKKNVRVSSVLRRICIPIHTSPFIDIGNKPFRSKTHIFPDGLKKITASQAQRKHFVLIPNSEFTSIPP